jgi:hypothetical protein
VKRVEKYWDAAKSPLELFCDNPSLTHIEKSECHLPSSSIKKLTAAHGERGFAEALDTQFAILRRIENANFDD